MHQFVQYVHNTQPVWHSLCDTG